MTSEGSNARSNGGQDGRSLTMIPPVTSLIVPDGCMDLIVLDAEVVVAGADTTARTFTREPRPAVGLRFDPGVLPQLLSTSAAELVDTIVPLAAIAPTGVPGSGSLQAKSRTLLDVAERLTSATGLDPRPLTVAALLRPRLNSGPVNIAEVAKDLAYSPRQLRRLSAEWFGYGPKHLAKILRWQSARGFIDVGHTRTSAAALAGYSDASHLWRDEAALLV